MPNLVLASKLNLHYLDENPQGKPVALLLHGLGANSQSWALQIPVLTGSGFRVIAPDLRGFGESNYRGDGLRIEDMATDIVELMSAREIRAVCVVGISMGGTVALSLVCDYAQLIEKVILVNTFARLLPTSLSELFYYAARFALIYTLGIQTQAKAVARHIFPKPDQEELRQMLIEEISQASPAGYRTSFLALARFNRTGCLSQVKTPTLVVTAANDTTVPTSIQRQLAEAIPHARQVIIPNAGHAVTVDQPAAFNREMMAFLCGSDRF